MSRELDYNNLSEDDKQWLRNRGWGNRIPGEGNDAGQQGVVHKGDDSLEEQLSKVPNTGTAVIRPEQFDLVNPVNPEGYTESDYKAWKVADLEQEIQDRNEGRDDADKIDSGDGKKATLVAAIVADDEKHAVSADEQPQQ